MPLRIPIGLDDFRALREQQLEYIDKSDLIRELLDRPGVQAIVFPRPRRFGKTLNLSMLRCWFEKRDEDLSHLFQDLAIWQAGDAYRATFQRYPVLHFNFKGIKGESFEECWGALKKSIEALFSEHLYLLGSDRLSEWEIRDYRAILDGASNITRYRRALLDLSSYLHRHHGEKVVILIDEYDEPIHAGHFHGYAARIIDFLGAFLTNGLKSNPHLYRAVVTGILRVGNESLFLATNNLGVYTLLAKQFNTCFGFTEAEVTTLLERNGRADKLEAVRAWYSGFLFGGAVIYNPWSVLSFLQREEENPKPYWPSTSESDLVRELLERYALELEPVFETLREGGAIERVLDENVVLSELHESEHALWSLLVFSGYLKAVEVTDDPLGRAVYRLSIPNREVRHVYATTFRTWMENRVLVA